MITRDASGKSLRGASGCALGAPRVLFAGKVTALDAPGGGEVQMSALARSLGEIGVTARPWRPWEEPLNAGNCLHLFGSLPEHLPLVHWAKRKGLAVVLSTIAWFDLASCWREPWSFSRRLTACGKFLTRAAFPAFNSWRRRLYHAVDLLLPNSQAEAEQLTRYFGVAPRRIRVVPNGADTRFADASPEPFARLVGHRNFILCAGRIEPRKNQLGVIKALSPGNVPLVVLGDVVPGHEAYLAACRRAAAPHVRFIGRLDHDDPLLASAYAACGCLVLAGWYETPGLAALEAGMSGTPLVLPRGGCAREYFGEHADYVAPNNPAGLWRAVRAALAKGRSRQLAELVRGSFSWRSAALATREAYATIV
ncbi:MAG TPA: glycosyltransferase [Pirellulales bacterium]|nr:glycosyltransferase [Pirellulales bacterium]